MGSNKKAFGNLLTQGLRQIKTNTGTNLLILEDELSYAIGKESGGPSTIGYFRRGHIPTDPLDVLHLAQELVKRNGLNQDECSLFLTYADYPNPQETAQLIFTQFQVHSPANGTLQNNGLLVLERPMNPFIVGPPIENPNQFFGRAAEQQQIFKSLGQHPMQHYAIIGPRRCGKSSLLKQIRNICYSHPSQLRKNQKNDWLAKPQTFQWVAIDFQDPRTHTMPRLLGSILQQVGVSNAPAKCDLTDFMDLFTEKLDQPTVILMDEIEAALSASNLPITLWWALRSIVNSSSNGNLSFIITSHENPMMAAEQRDKASPFFNIFYSLNLGPLLRSEVYEYFDHAPLKIKTDDAEWIIEQSRGWPILVQLLTQLLWMDQEERSISNWKTSAMLHLQTYAHLSGQ